MQREYNEKKLHLQIYIQPTTYQWRCYTAWHRRARQAAGTTASLPRPSSSAQGYQTPSPTQSPPASALHSAGVGFEEGWYKLKRGGGRVMTGWGVWWSYCVCVCNLPWCDLYWIKQILLVHTFHRPPQCLFIISSLSIQYPKVTHSCKAPLFITSTGMGVLMLPSPCWWEGSVAWGLGAARSGCGRTPGLAEAGTCRMKVYRYAIVR